MRWPGCDTVSFIALKTVCSLLNKLCLAYYSSAVGFLKTHTIALRNTDCVSVSQKKKIMRQVFDVKKWKLNGHVPYFIIIKYKICYDNLGGRV